MMRRGIANLSGTVCKRPHQYVRVGENEQEKLCRDRGKLPAEKSLGADRIVFFSEKLPRREARYPNSSP